MNQRLSSLSALIFMTHGNFDTEKVLVTFSRVRNFFFFYFSRKLQSGNDLINARFLGHGLRACQFVAVLAVRHAVGLGREGLKERKRQERRKESRQMKSTCTNPQNMVIGLPFAFNFSYLSHWILTFLPYWAFWLFDLWQPSVDLNRLDTHCMLWNRD